MRSDKFLRGRRIFVLAPAFGEHVLFARGQDREPTNCRKIVIEAAFGGDDGRDFGISFSPNWFLSTQRRRRRTNIFVSDAVKDLQAS